MRRNTKTALMTNKKTLRSIDRYRHTYVNDDLTPLRSRMLRTLKNDDEVKRVWTIDGIFHCIVVENNAEVKKRLETPDDWLSDGWYVGLSCVCLRACADGLWTVYTCAFCAGGSIKLYILHILHNIILHLLRLFYLSLLL